MSEKPKFETAENLGERFLGFKNNLKERRDRGGQEDWKVGFGEYYNPLVGKPWDDEKIWKIITKEGGDPEKVPIYGVEKHILEGIQNSIKEKRDRGDKSPVIAVDFGGVRSISFLRIAKELEKDGYISNGDVSIFVTNLNFDPNGEQDDINEERINFFDRYKNLVHFISTDARELQKQKIIVNGEEIPLKGNVDFIHENMALTHGHINDVDWILLGRMLAPSGQLISKTTTEGLHPGQGAETQQEYNVRKKAHQMGIRNMQKMGLQKQDLGPDANYDIFLKPE